MALLGQLGCEELCFSQTFQGSVQPFPSPAPFPTFLRCQLLSCPGSTVVTPLLTHPHLPAFLSSTYCFPSSLTPSKLRIPPGTPGVQSSPGRAWDPFSLLHWVTAVKGKGVLVCSFSTHWTSQVLSAPSVKYAEYKCVNSFGVWWCPLHKQIHQNPRLLNVNSLGERLCSRVFPKDTAAFNWYWNPCGLGSQTIKCSLKTILTLFFFSWNWKRFFKQNKRESWQGKLCWQLEHESYRKWCLLGSLLARCFSSTDLSINITY